MTLSAIWAEVLGLTELGIHDNFFELGGDSILSIQIVARANQAGLRLAPKHLFQYQTVAELALVADEAAVAQPLSSRTPARAEVAGAPPREVALTPIQRWFFEQNFVRPHHWNQSLLLEVRQAISGAALSLVVRRLVRRHEALRLRFVREGGNWRQSVSAAEASSAAPPLSEIDLSELEASAQSAALERAAGQAQASLDLSAGPLLRVVLFELGAGRAQRLLMVAHHLVTDGVSWRILLEELRAGYVEAAGQGASEVQEGEAAEGEAGSFAAWAERLSEYALSAEVQGQVGYWGEVERAAAKFRLPRDLEGAGRGEEGETRQVSVELTVEETRGLLQEVPRAYRTRINEVLLTALGRALSRWSGRRQVAVEMEGHGREEIAEGVGAQVQGAMGWFTSLYPVVLEAEWGEVGEGLKEVKEQVRGVPGGGLGYGLLRYLKGEAQESGRAESEGGASQRAASEAAGGGGEVLFNYLGQLDNVLEDDGLFVPAAESPGPAISPLANRSHLLEINGSIVNGRLQLIWNYSETVHHRSTIERVADDYIESLKAIIDHCRLPESRGFTPADFPETKLSQTELNELVRRGQKIEDILTLSPMQEGMLFHRLYNPESGQYVAQFIITVRGDLNPHAFEQAWLQVAQRQSVLRTDFIWEGRDNPLQIVREHVTLPWEQQDWRELSPTEQEERLQTYLQNDRQRGFELTCAPLMRLLLIRTNGDAYQLVWSFAMMLLDGWSVGPLLGEVFMLYEALCRNESAQLAQPRPYRDYISWLQGQPLAEAERFWREKLRGFSSPTQLTLNRSVVGSHEVTGSQGQQQMRLSVEETAELSAMARGHQLTINTLVQGAWALLLSRYSGQAEVVFGTTVAGRPAQLRGVEEMVGLFINTLPVRVRINEGEGVSEWLRGLQGEAVEMRQYEHSPLVEVQGWSEVPRGTPLFESLLVFDNYPFDVSLAAQVKQKTGLEVPDLRVVEQTNFPLTITISPGEELGLKMSYEQERFDEETIGRMLGHFHHLLTAIAADPQRLVRDLPLLPDSERQQLLVEFNDTAAAFPSDLCLHQLFEEQVARTPESVALVFEDAEVSYQELNARANQLAHRLRRLGVSAESRVGILLERSIEMVVSLLAVLKAGGAYVPLDREYPGERVRFMLEDAEVCVLVTQEKLRQLLPGYEGEVLCLEAAQAEIALESEENVASGVVPENLAYVIYTSGSTGTPKGAMNTHRAICNRLLWMQAAYHLEAEDRVLQKTPFSFDVSVWEFFWPLLVGARLVMARVGGHRDSAYLIEEIMRSGITTLHFVPSMLRAFLGEAGLAGCRSLRRVISSGEELPGEVAEQLLGRVRWAQLHNLYGPTEAAVDVTAWECQREWSGETVPIGRPIWNTQVHVLGREMELVPVGVSGELYIGGEGVARGYLGRAELTAERFVPDPYGGEVGARLYRTGDIVRRQAEGTLLYLGRADQQVKVRGYRIELGEIEAVLREQAGVRECVVVAAPHSSGSPRLVAYVVGEDGSLTGEVGRWREQLSQQLPQYMVPSAWVMLEQLPLTPNGKIDRGGLPAAGESSRGGVEGWERARRPTEELLAGIWAEVLGVREVGLHDNFFELGGHSLLATQIISRVRKAFKVELALRSLFELPTVGEMASGIEESLKGEQGVASPPVLAVARDADLPLSFAQQRLWFLHQWEPSSPFYNSPSVVRLSGHLQLSVLRRTLLEVVRRHEVLRTTFPTQGGRPRQRITATLLPELPLVDLSTLDPEVAESAATQLARDEAQRPFDLSAGPLLRVTLLRLSEEEHVLLFTLHHIVSDGWSMGLLVREVAALYRAYQAGEDSPLEELPVQYADYAQWQRGWLQGEVLERQLAYWRQQLAGAPPVLELPTDRARPVVQSYRGAAWEFRLGEELTGALKELSRRCGVTLFMTLLAGFEVLLWRLSGQADIVVGTAIANRTRRETEALIGFFVNTLVLRVEVRGEESFEELVGRVREVCLGAYGHQEVPFERLVEELRPERSLSHSPLFQVAFGVDNSPREALELPGLKLSGMEQEDEAVRFDLTLWVVEEGGELSGRWTYRSELFEAARVEQMSGHWERLLESIVARPAGRVETLEMFTEAELAQKVIEEMVREELTSEKLLMTTRKAVKLVEGVT